MTTRHQFIKEKKVDSKTSVLQYRWEQIRKYLGSKQVYYNPVQDSCPSKYIFDALYELGPNTWHHIDAVQKKTIEIMSSVSSVDNLSQWDAYFTRITKHNIDPQVRLKRIITNLKTHYNPYLTEMGCGLEVKKEDNEKYIYLNTKATTLDRTDYGNNNANKSAFRKIYTMFCRVKKWFLE